MLAGAIMLAGGPITLVVAIIGALILGLIALGAGLVVAYNKSETFRNIVNSAFKAIGDFWTNTLKPKLMEIKDLFVNHILPAAKKVAEEGLKGLKEGLNYVKAALDRNKPAIDDVKSAINTLYKALKKIVEYISDNVAPVVGPILRTAFRIAGASISMVIDLIGTLIRAFTRAVNVAKGIANGIKAAFNFSLQAEGARIAGSLVSGLFSKARDVASAAFSLAGIINNALRGRSPTKEGPLSGRGWTRYSGQSMVEALAKGMYDREHILRSASIAIAQAASPHAQANYRATYSMAGQRRESPVGLGQAGDRGNVTMYNDWTINTAEINPTQHSVELGRELVRRVPTI
jgi:phage-related protein